MSSKTKNIRVGVICFSKKEYQGWGMQTQIPFWSYPRLFGSDCWRCFVGCASCVCRAFLFRRKTMLCCTKKQSTISNFLQNRLACMQQLTFVLQFLHKLATLLQLICSCVCFNMSSPFEVKSSQFVHAVSLFKRQFLSCLFPSFVFTTGMLYQVCVLKVPFQRPMRFQFVFSIYSPGDNLSPICLLKLSPHGQICC